MRKRQEAQTSELCVIELRLLLQESGLTSQELLGCGEAIHLCCPRVGTLIECLEDPITVWLNFGLVFQLGIAVLVVFLHVFVLFFLVLLSLGDNTFESHFLLLEIFNKLLGSCHFSLVLL